MKINDTLRFVLPMLYNAKLGLDNDFFFNKFFVGAYTADLHNPCYDDNNILLVYKNDYSEEFIEFEAQMLSSLYIKDVYGDDVEDIIVYVVPIPEEFKYDYELICTGNYPKLSPALRLNIFKMWDLVNSDNLAKILNGEAEYEGEDFDEQTLKLN